MLVDKNKNIVDLNEDEIEAIKNILVKLKYMDEDSYDSISSIGKLTGDIVSDIKNRKFLADLVIAKKLKLLKDFINIFGY